MKSEDHYQSVFLRGLRTKKQIMEEFTIGWQGAKIDATFDNSLTITERQWFRQDRPIP